MKDEESPASRAETGDVRENRENSETRGFREDEGGEAACWLHRLCPVCDAVQDAPHPGACWRCGAELTGTVEGADLR